MRFYAGDPLIGRQNEGIVGDDLADIESGIIADWYRNAKSAAPLELSPYRYSLTGHPDTRMVIGKISGIATVEIYLDQRGLKASSEQVMEIVAKIKEKAFEKMGLLTLGEFEELARNVLDGERIVLTAEGVKYFYLTSPFIELAILACSMCVIGFTKRRCAFCAKRICRQKY